MSIKTKFIALWDGFTTVENAQVLVLTATNCLSKFDESNTLMSPSSIWNWCFGSKGKDWDIKCYLEGWVEWIKHWLWMYSLLMWRLHWFRSLCLAQESDIFLSFRELLGEEKKGEKLWFVRLYGALNFV